MSTATVSSPKKSQSSRLPARWDDEKTKILLEAFEEEINKGNRPGGIYSKQAWINIITNFNQRTGLGYNKDQLKNRQDNLRREFTKWETLIGKETGLGWDNDRRTLSAPDSWWAEKAQVDPYILRYKDAGPIHLDLLQKVFGGVTATGAHLYVPGFKDPLLGGDDHIEDINDTQVEDIGVANEGEEVHETAPNTSNRASSSKLRARKRLRDEKGKRVNHTAEYMTTVSSLNDTIRENLVVLRDRADEPGITYSDAIDLLKALPGFTYDDDAYWKAVRVLEDKTRRIAFFKILDGGTKAVNRWLQTFPDA